MNANLGEWFNTILSVNADAFASQHYEAAYHALMAALHLAADEANVAHIEQVARLAREQATILDSQSPSHRLSSQSAHARHHLSIYAMAAQQAEARARMIPRSGKHADAPLP